MPRRTRRSGAPSMENRRRSHRGGDRPGRAGRPGVPGVVPAHLGRPLATEVIGTALQHGEGEGGRAAERVGQEGQVVRGQLVLERLCGSGHDTRRREDRREDEGLARARPGLENEVAALVDGPGNGLCHVLLSGAVLAAAGQRHGHLGEGGGDVA